MRKFLAVALMTTSVVVPGVNLAAPKVAAATVPSGFTDVAVASLGASTGIVGMPDGTVMVLVQSGSVRLIRNDVLLPTPALSLGLSPCHDSEQGLLGVALDEDFAVNGFVYLYYTRPSPPSPGGCLNRVSRFTMSGDVIDPSSEIVLVDNISARNTNHNGGDLEIGGDGFLYISVGDAGTDPHADSSPNDAAQDLSLLNGKILRVVPSTGEPAPGNPLSGAGTASCRVRGNLPSTPTTACQELYAWGLRNPYRFAFDPNTGPQRFFINDVGASTREEVDEGGIGRNYGWSVREGVCPIGQNPPCAAADPAAGFTEPITDYPRSVGQVITAGAFIPNGHWPAEYDGALLLRRCRQRRDVVAPSQRDDRLRRSVRDRRGRHRRHGVRHDEHKHCALLHPQRWGCPQDLQAADDVCRPGSVVIRGGAPGQPRARHQAGAGGRHAGATPTPPATCRWASILR